MIFTTTTERFPELIPLKQHLELLDSQERAIHLARREVEERADTLMRRHAPTLGDMRAQLEEDLAHALLIVRSHESWGDHIASAIRTRSDGSYLDDCHILLCTPMTSAVGQPPGTHRIHVVGRSPTSAVTYGGVGRLWHLDEEVFAYVLRFIEGSSFELAMPAWDHDDGRAFVIRDVRLGR